jgi:hypothetical protein
MKAVVLMPTGGNCPHRLDNQEFTISHYAKTYGIETVLGHDTSGRQYWSRARAVNDAYKKAITKHPDLEILIIADNDLIPDQKYFELGLRLMINHSAVIPHYKTKLLSKSITEHFKRQNLGTDQVHGRLIKPGSISFVIIKRDAFELINGMDELFEGWGAEDNAFLENIKKQLQSIRRLKGIRTHLWHPTDPTRSDAEQLRKNRARFYEYKAGKKRDVILLANEYGKLIGDAHETV